MSGSVSRGLIGDKTALGEFSKHNIYGGLWTPEHKHSDAGTLPLITRRGNWCIYEANRFCQESRCSDCIVCEEYK